MNMNWLILCVIVCTISCIYGFSKYSDNNAPKWLEGTFNIGLVAIVIIFIEFFGIEITLLGLLLLLAPFWFWAKKQIKTNFLSKDGVIFQLASLFPFLLVIFVVRAFVIQPYRVPTGSLAPTVHVGDFILANQMTYGLKMPVNHWQLFAVNSPQRGDIALFYWPVQPDTILVKRVIGLPGDHISYHSHVLKINDQIVKAKFIANTSFTSHDVVDIEVKKLQETLPGNIKHDIYRNENENNQDGDGDWVVPAKNYFMMGDNRDNSNDSRFWGMVPESALVGKAMFVWMNLNVPAIYQKKWSQIVLWRRIGQLL